VDKKVQSSTRKQKLSEFTAKLTASWRLRTQPNTPSTFQQNKSTEDILRDLIAMPTVTGNYEANHEALDYIARFLQKSDMHLQRYEWNGVESLVATTRRTKTPKVMLAAHIDVVSAPNQLFQLRKQNGKYYGRGVLDMKGAAAAYLGALRELGDDLSAYDFGIMITTDEEVGGYDGAAMLAQEGYVPEIMVLPDGGSNWDIERFAKGIWFVTLEAKGKNAHGSRPWEGINAIDMLLAALADIKALFPKQSDETSTVNIGIVRGGHAINQIPSSASASIDFRFADMHEMETLRAKILAIAEQYGLSYTTEVTADPVQNDPAHPLLKAYAACTQDIIGRPVRWIVSNAGNDGRFFASLGSQLAVSYPEGANHHGLEEYITVESLERMQRLFVTYLRTVAAGQHSS
jgi:acetylornithine deacetylase/succinyl-diaminopimelate desuccinylase-like protein